MSYQDIMREKRRNAGRPVRHEDLLFDPIADDPSAATACYDGWEFDHGGAQRFYVGGLRWFMRQTGIDQVQSLAGYGELAVRIAAEETQWTSMLNSGRHWAEISQNQFRSAKKIEKVYFQKAALIILTCELALRDRIANKMSMPSDIKPEDVYTMMSIIPACWNIDDFDKKFLSQLNEKHPDAIAHLRAQTGQSLATIENLTAGFTTTSRTAHTIKREIDTRFKSVSCGRVRATPGGAGLGKKPASINESVDAG